MKKYLVLVMLLISGIANAEDIKFTDAQKETLKAKVMNMKIAEADAKDFARYLSAEYKIDQTYIIKQDFSGFERLPEPPKESNVGK